MCTLIRQLLVGLDFFYHVCVVPCFYIRIEIRHPTVPKHHHFGILLVQNFRLFEKVFRNFAVWFCLLFPYIQYKKKFRLTEIVYIIQYISGTLQKKINIFRLFMM